MTSDYRPETVALFNPLRHEFRPRSVEDHPILLLLHRAECVRRQQSDAAHPLALLKIENGTCGNLQKFLAAARA